MCKQPDNTAKIVAYADDVTAGGALKDLKALWSTLCDLGPKFGYFPEASKSWLIVKKDKIEEATKLFKSCQIKITSDGKKHLGAVIGSISYKKQYVNNKVENWINEIRILSQIAKTEPQAAYSCFTSGWKHKLTYFMRTIPGISELLQKLDVVIDTEFIPSITGGITPSRLERSLLSLPTKLGGLGIPIFSEISMSEYNNSCMLTNHLRTNIVNQAIRYERNSDLKEIRSKITQLRNNQHHEKLRGIKNEMNDTQKKLNEINQEPGASIWLSTIPLIEEGYTLNKQAFTDMIKTRYGWQLQKLPENCVCGQKFNVEHALSCKKGGFVTIRHNKVRDITANLLKIICNDVQVEPTLLPLSGESFVERTANLQDSARVDVSARGFWIAGQKAFFDMRVFNPLAKRYREHNLEKCYEINEKEKKRHYNERVQNVDHGSFTPVVMSANGGFGREAKHFYSKLAEKIAEKRDEHYSIVAAWVRRKIMFSLINSLSLCIRGSNNNKKQ